MAPLRNCSMELMTRSSRPVSNSLTSHNRNGPATSINKEYGISYSEWHDEPVSEFDFNEDFIQSIEELLPEKEHAEDRLAHPALHQSLERAPSTPGRPIKLEKISNTLADVYDASPYGYVRKSAHCERRQNSRSTAQLTTPASSPECKCSSHHLTETHLMAKSEIGQKSSGSNGDFDSNCTPPPESSPGKITSFKGPARKRLPTTPQISPSRRLQRNPDTEDSRDSYGVTEGPSTAIILPRRSIIQPSHGVKDAMACSRKSHAFISKCLPTKEGHNKRPGTECLQKLPLAKYRPSLSRKSTSPVPVRVISTPSSAPTELLQNNGISSGNKTCCKLMCLECVPKNLQEEYGLGPPEERSSISRSQSSSACTSSVSSFGTDDDVPNSNEQIQVVRRAVMDHTKQFASDRLPETSLSLRYNNPCTHLGDHALSSSVEDTFDRCDDIQVEKFKRKNPCRSICSGTSKIMSKDKERFVRGIIQRSLSLKNNVGGDEQQSQHSPRYSLRSCSISDNISRKLQSTKDQISRREVEGSNRGGDGEESIQYGPEDGVSSIDESSGGSPFKLNPARSTSRNASSQALPEVRDSDQTAKRGREMVEEEHATYFYDEDVESDDDLVEIHGDIFRASENRRKKRHKRQSQDAIKNPNIRSPSPKEEQFTENEEIFVEAHYLGTGEVPTNNTTGTTIQEILPCDYYMNTYWEHGRASDGRRARDGFTSYLDFKEYCKKNKQPIDDRCMLTYKKDLKHYLLCEHHATLRQDLFRVAWNFEHNPGFSFKSCNKDEATRRLQDEAIGNAPSPGSVSRGVPVAAAAAGVDAEVVDMIGDILKGIGTSHAADVAQLTKSKKKLESEVKGLKRRLARIRKR